MPVAHRVTLHGRRHHLDLAHHVLFGVHRRHGHLPHTLASEAAQLP